MASFRVAFLLLAVAYICSNYMGEAVIVSPTEWASYKATYRKDYATPALENAARYNYAYNKYYIEMHNRRATRGLFTYELKVGPFTDMRLVNYKAFFPKADPVVGTFDVSPVAPVMPSPAAVHIIDDNAITGIQVADQGTLCNSGWAYATAKAIEVWQAKVNPGTLNVWSAQQLLNCAGGAKGCINQNAQAAFDYLRTYEQSLYTETDVPPATDGVAQGMCLALATASPALKLTKYTRIVDIESIMKGYLAAGMPVVVEIDPTSFEFMNYGSGIFKQPAKTAGGSHFAVVIGYDVDAATAQEYWHLMNSFGENWGEQGYMRVANDAMLAIAKNAIFPSEATVV